MKTRHPVEGSFGSEFPVICNNCVVIDALKLQDAKQYTQSASDFSQIGSLSVELYASRR